MPSRRRDELNERPRLQPAAVIDDDASPTEMSSPEPCGICGRQVATEAEVIVSVLRGVDQLPQRAFLSAMHMGLLRDVAKVAGTTPNNGDTKGRLVDKIIIDLSEGSL